MPGPRLAALLVPLAVATAARADAPQCHLIRLSFVPTDQLQIAAWIEKPDGTFVDTIYLTQKVGRYGLGNRPGRFDFNSGPVKNDLWPYGRRITVLPVWAHRRAAGTGQDFPEIVFQNGAENDLSHPFDQSSPETTPPYCRPMAPSENGWDAGTCATQEQVYTDKGTFDPNGARSVYPPRADITATSVDSPSVAMYKALNPFDAVTQATPAGGQCTQIAYPIPSTLAPGDYVMWVEVNGEFDYNATYNATSFPPPSGIPFASFGKPYRGQPSIVYSVPFTVSTAESDTSTGSYVGYGDPSGATGTLNPPDATITTDTPGSGASRLELIPGSTDRLRVDVLPESDGIAPGAPTALTGEKFDRKTASEVVSFVAPGDDGETGSVAGYEVRVRANSVMTADNFADSMPVIAQITPSSSGSSCGGGAGFPPAGTLQEVRIAGLLPETDYWVGVRAFDKCHNLGPIAISKFTTPQRVGGEVDACFVATAAYGSVMANDVELLRHFRDALLESNVLGELAVETYYTFGPPVAGVVGQSELLRWMARDLIAPIVARVRSLAF